MAVTISQPNNVETIKGNSLAIFKDASSGKFFAKDINGSIENISDAIGGTQTLQQVLDAGNTATSDVIIIGNIQASGSVIGSNIITNTTNIATNTANISTNTTNISTNASAIQTETNERISADTDLANDIATNTANISTNTTNISTNASAIQTETNERILEDIDLQNAITTNATNISTNASNISTVANNLDAEETARILADTDLANDIATNTANISTNASAIVDINNFAVFTNSDANLNSLSTNFDIISLRDIIASNRIEAGGDIVAFSSSDKRLKDNIEQIPNAIDKIQSIGGYSFDWNDKQDTYEVGSRDIGVVAQEIEEVLPELVITRDNGYKAVKYEKMVALLIEGIKEQQEQINELKTKLDGITK